MIVSILFLSALLLAYANGANDNFKGVATLYGSRTVRYPTAIRLATIATFSGSIASFFLAQGLVANFSGKGLVPQDVASGSVFLLSVGIGAAVTVLLATRLGFPISTTHSLVGGLLGAGIMAVGWEVNFQRLGGTFFAPLFLSPFVAFSLTAIVYWIFKHARGTMGINKESCICVGEERRFVPVSSLTGSGVSYLDGTIALGHSNCSDLSLTVADTNECVDLYTDRVWGLGIQKLLDVAHVISATLVSFARGLNDTPKIAGLIVGAQVFELRWGMSAIAVGMALGGLLSARRVAETMSKKITELTHGQGFSANLITGFLVIVASQFGVPVSTTHVSVGAIVGIGSISGHRNSKMITNIILSWLVTLPIAMGFSAFLYFMFS